jgi:hypothetical protein
VNDCAVMLRSDALPALIMTGLMPPPGLWVLWRQLLM